jgi:hypothetical protein
MLSNTFLPFKSLRLISLKSLLVNVNSGAAEPVAGKLPEVCTSFPPNKIDAIKYDFYMIDYLLDINQLHGKMFLKYMFLPKKEALKFI